ncbi:succinate dehydrogenase, cytochrome b556 subunit [Methylobrevis pamukkalensis]|uniref:Succinate dehydrogenase cytochrome b556 subunit n=1 Tax=Methylobrevis pamukkalensis TaxID=1439726 RepID=A0A1E3H415_9HYPH|nr:succinate dehydrogenase, cytochrome b556 subunit [Methylobrevis pamukkalensis]ODN70271.1 Succinate dehydrogenase cytochrome b556 subunit [Methylobrevis pamukkalensis]
MADLSRKSARPLSPHLQIYRPMLTMMMSIVHRITGSALYVGTLLLVWWLVAAAAGPAYFEVADGFFGSIVGQLILFGYTWALLHHMLGGIRHFIWDFGHGHGAEARELLAKGTLAGSIVLTILVWIVVIILR